MNILIISSFPPPVGGVTIHTLRLTNYLLNDGHKVHVLSPRIRNLHLIICYSLFVDVIHVHSYRFLLKTWIWLLLIRIILRKRIILTVHSLRTNVPLSKPALKTCNTIIAVNREIKCKLNSRHPKLENVSVISPFLPYSEDERDLFQDLNDEENVFFAEGNVIAFNAWKVVIEDNEDIYGVDLILRAFSLIAERDEAVRLCLCIPNLDVFGMKYISYLSNKYNIDSTRLLVIDKEIWFIDVLNRSRLFVRPNRSDGDPLSIKEAQMLGVKVVASDCVQRPNDVIIFRSGSVESLVIAIEKGLHSSEYRAWSNSNEGLENYRKVLLTYGALNGGKSIMDDCCSS